MKLHHSHLLLTNLYLTLNRRMIKVISSCKNKFTRGYWRLQTKTKLGCKTSAKKITNKSRKQLLLMILNKLGTSKWFSNLLRLHGKVKKMLKGIWRRNIDRLKVLPLKTTLRLIIQTKGHKKVRRKRFARTLMMKRQMTTMKGTWEVGEVAVKTILFQYNSKTSCLSRSYFLHSSRTKTKAAKTT